MRVAVLAYHSQNVNGNTYGTNDHVALARDLAAIREARIPVVGLRALVDAWLDGGSRDVPPAAVALTCDDGTTLDWLPFDHPAHGPQPPLRDIVAAHALAAGTAAKGLLTSFVIASPAARREIDAGCYAGYPLSDESWWRDAQSEGTIDIENHSWDHVHPCVSVVAQRAQAKGNFALIETWGEADAQIRRSAAYIGERLAGTGHVPALFAYPYGHVNAYLSERYLPEHIGEHGVKAAFADHPAYWTDAAHRYRIPRFVCGLAWQDERGFARILDGLTAA
jgi:hypothetical protein